MSENLIQLESVMSEELRIFSNILRLEREKSEAIVNKDGFSLQKLSQEQEDFLARIDPIEKDRQMLTSYYSRKNADKDPTLEEIISIEGLPESPLAQIGELLKKTINRIRMLQETNTRMINDNLDYFQLMLRELRQFSTDVGYSERGLEKSSSKNSFLVDKKI